MPWTLFADAAQAGKIERLDSGFIRVRGRVARTGVQDYAPWPGAPIQDRMIKVYRPPEQVFADSSVKTLKGVPVTIGHPPERAVDAKTWKRYAVGHNEGESKRVSDSGDEYIESSLLIQDAAAVAAVEGKELVEISQGYTVELDWTPGVTADGIKYDAVQTQIAHNHTALLGVGDARAGSGARVLLDSMQEDRMTKEEFQKLLESQLALVDSKRRSKVSKHIQDSVEPMLDALDPASIKGLVEGIIGAVMSNGAPAATDEDLSEEEKKKKEEELAAADEDLSEEEKKKKEAANDHKAGEALAKQFLDSQAKTLEVIDAREECRPMLGDSFDYAGKSAHQLRLAAIKAKAPEMHKSLVDASEDAVRGAFTALKSMKTAWISNDANPDPIKPDDHFVAYEKRMNDCFDSTWGNK